MKNSYLFHVRQLGLQPYQAVFQAMRDFTSQRQSETIDELWLVQHPPVFTQGQTGKESNLIMPGDIPVIQSDRGGQVTYHGPGQQILYVLLEMRRHGLSVRQLVSLLEQTTLLTLSDYHIQGQLRMNAPGVYISENKICSLGLRVRRGCSFHGMALNVAMDLEPFSRINPCGYIGLKMTQLSDYYPTVNIGKVSEQLVSHFTQQLAGISGNDIQSKWLPWVNTTI